MASSAERAQERQGPADPEKLVFADDGVFPNSRLPVLIYREALRTPDAARGRRGDRSLVEGEVRLRRYPKSLGSASA